MKIDIVTPFFYPALGGVETYALELSRRLEQRGHSVNVHTYGKILGEKMAANEVIDGVKIFRYYPLVDIYYYYKFWTPKIKDTDIVHIIGYGHMCSALTIRKYFQKFPLVMATIGVSAPISGPKSFWLRKQFDKFFGVNQLKKMKKIIVIAEEERNWCLKNGIAKEKIIYIPVGIPDAAFVNYSDGDLVEKKFGIKKPYIIYLGRIHPQKGLEYLFKAFSRVQKNIPEVSLVLVGPDNNFWSTLNNFARNLNISNQIKYLNYVSEQDKYNLLSISEFVVLPSMYELQGIVLVEAMAQARPVIATKVGGIPDFVVDGENGYLVEYGDTDSLARRIEDLFQNEVGRKKMGEKARQVAERYRWNKVVDQYEILYKEIIRQQK